MTFQIKVLYPEGISAIQDSELKPTLEDLQRIVGGYLEPISVLNEDTPRRLYRTMLVDEDGRQKQRPLNAEATRLYRAAWGSTPAIVGTAVLLMNFKLD